MYLGDEDALRAWHGAYRHLSPELALAAAHLATARAVLYYADEFGHILRRLPGWESCRDWPAVARRRLRLDNR